MKNTAYFKLTKQPLLFVLAEFRFPIIMKMESYLSDLHEAFRKQFPLFETQNTQEIQLSAQGIEVHTTKQWALIDQSRKNAIIIGQSRLVCMTSDYNRFNHFEQFCLNAIQILNSVVKPAFFNRIGLRYADLIVSHKKLPINQAISPTLLKQSFWDALGTTTQKSEETIIKTQEGVIAIKSLYGTHALSTLSDVNSLPITLALNTEQNERIILDFDHIWQNDENPFDIDINKLSTKLKSMHAISREAFWLATTPSAREHWK